MQKEVVSEKQLNRDLERIRLILKKHCLKPEEAIGLLKQPLIPISIFRSKCGPLGALIVYLKKRKGLRFSEIARALNRDQRTIWTTYNRAKACKPRLDFSHMVNLNIFGNRKLSIMENLVLHLKEKGLRLIEISKMLGRSNKTVWCFYHRALKKNES